MSATDHCLPPGLAELARLADDAEPRLGPDPESQAWVDGLASYGAEREPTVRALRALLLRAARFEIDRRRASVSRLSDGDSDDLAQQCADNALAAAMSRLGDLRDGSRFTTWACKFAIFEAARSVRRLQPASSRVSSAAGRTSTIRATD